MKNLNTQGGSHKILVASLSQTNAYVKKLNILSKTFIPSIYHSFLHSLFGM